MRDIATAQLDWVQTSKVWQLRNLDLRLKQRLLLLLGRKLDADQTR